MKTYLLYLTHRYTGANPHTYCHQVIGGHLPTLTRVADSSVRPENAEHSQYPQSVSAAIYEYDPEEDGVLFIGTGDHGADSTTQPVYTAQSGTPTTCTDCRQPLPDTNVYGTCAACL